MPRGGVAFCINSSVGIRYRERRFGDELPIAGRLAALGWRARKVSN